MQNIIQNHTKLDRIFIINLKHRTDRKQHILSEMKKQNMTNYEFFDAIRPTMEDVREWNKNFCNHVRAHVHPTKFDNYRIGCLGCLKSHIEVIKIALSRGYKKILVLEDDTVFIQSFSKFYEICERIKDYDMMYLSGSHMKPYKKLPNLKNIVKVTSTNTTGSYCIGDKAMHFIVSNIIGYPKEIDTFYSLFVQPKFDCYCIIPHMTKQLDGYSDIQNQDIKYKLSDYAF